MSQLPPLPTRGSDILTWAKRIQDVVKSITPQSSTSIRVSRMVGGTTFEFVRLNYGVRAPFEVQFNDANSVLVHFGQWPRNGQILTMGVDGGQTFKTLSGLNAASTRYFITLTLTDSTVQSQDGLFPDTLTVSAELSEPVESNQLNEKMVIALVDTDGSGDIDEVIQKVEGNIPDDIGWMGDADTTLTAVTPYTKSIQSKTAGGTHSLEAELFDFVSPTAFAGTLDTVSDYVLMRDANRGDASGADLIYVAAGKFADWVETFLVIDGGQVTPFTLRHTDTDGTGSTPGGQNGSIKANTDHDFDYWPHGSTFANCYGQSIGRSSTRDSSVAVVQKAIDLTNNQWLRRSGGSDLVVGDWQAGKFFELNGVELSIDWFGGSLHNPVNSTTSIDYNERWCYDDAGTTIRISYGNALAAAKPYLNENWECRGDFDVTAGNDYFHAGVQGITVANWIGGGIVTGTGIVEKLHHEVGPNDKVLVIPA